MPCADHCERHEASTGLCTWQQHMQSTHQTKNKPKKAAIMLVGIMHSYSAALHNKSEQKQSSILTQRTPIQITGPSLQLHEALCQWEVRKVNDEGLSHCAGLPPATQSEKLVAKKDKT